MMQRSPGGESPSANGRCTNSFGSDGNPNEESPSFAASFCKTAQTSVKGSYASGIGLTIIVPVPQDQRPLAPKFEDRHSDSTSPVVQKLPPPPPTAEYRYVMSRPLQTSPMTTSPQSKRAELKRDTTPDLIVL